MGRNGASNDRSLTRPTGLRLDGSTRSFLAEGPDPTMPSIPASVLKLIEDDLANSAENAGQAIRTAVLSLVDSPEYRLAGAGQAPGKRP